MFERKVVIRLNEGLHARPATQFVKLARSFASDLEVLKQGKSANAKSAVKLMLLGVKEHEEVVVRGEGEDAQAAVEALCAYAGQDEPAAEAPPPPPEPQGAPTPFGRGVPASGGAAVGEAFVYMPDEIVAPRRVIGASEVAAELRRLRSARGSVDQDLKRRAAAAPPDSPQAEIVVALMEIVADEDLVARMEAKIAAVSTP